MNVIWKRVMSGFIGLLILACIRQYGGSFGQNLWVFLTNISLGWVIADITYFIFGD